MTCWVKQYLFSVLISVLLPSAITLSSPLKSWNSNAPKHTSDAFMARMNSLDVLG